MKKLVLILFAVFAAAAAFWLELPAYRRWKESSFLARARGFLAKGDLHSADLSARKTLAINSRNVEACRLMAIIQEKSRSPQTILWRSRVVEFEPAPTSNRLDLARSALLLGNRARAAEVLSTVNSADTNTVDFQTLSSGIALAAKDLATAGAHAQIATQLDPRSKAAQYNLAVLQLQSREPATLDSARTNLIELAADPSYRRECLRCLALSALAHNHVHDAVDFSRQLQQPVPLAFEDRLLHLTALKESASEELTTFLPTLESAAATNAFNLDALTSWLRGHQMSDEALRWLLSLPDNPSEHPQISELIAACYGDRNQWDQSHAVLENRKWVEMDFIRRALLARASRAQKEESRAQVEWRGAVAAAAEQLKPLSALLQMAENWGWTNEVEALAWKIADGFPGQQPRLAALNQFYATKGDTRGLWKVSAALIKHAPTDDLVKNNFAALSLLLNTDTNKAHQIAREIYLRRPQDGIIASTYAFSLHLQGRTGEGVELLQKLEPAELRTPAVATYYGVLLAALGQFSKAEPYLEIASQSAHILPEEKRLVSAARGTSMPGL